MLVKERLKTEMGLFPGGSGVPSVGKPFDPEQVRRALDTAFQRSG